MPVVYVKHGFGRLLCPQRGVVKIDACYNCPHFVFRNYRYLVCRLEFLRKFGENYEVVSKEPLVVRDDVGNLWIWACGDGHPYNWYRYGEDGTVDYSEALE